MSLERNGPQAIAILYQHITDIDLFIFTVTYKIALYEVMSILLIYPGYTRIFKSYRTSLLHPRGTATPRHHIPAGLGFRF